MAVMLTEEELGARIQRSVRAARAMEREEIVGTIQDFADTALGNGELNIADRLVQVIEFVRGSVAATTQVETTVGVQTEVLAEAELPPVREIADDDEIRHLTRKVPRTTLGLEATLPVPRD
jgi:hypothetical protein